MTLELFGKRAVVTGGGRDFGRALSIWLAREGVHVDLCARQLTDAEATCSAIRAEGYSASPYRCDLTNPVSIAEFATNLRSHRTPVDFLILSAAQWMEGDLGDGTPMAEIVGTIASGLTGSILLTDSLLPELRRSDVATIVAMVSSCGRPGYTESVAHPAFYAAKHGMAGFISILGHRLTADGIKVCGVYPPDFETRDPISPSAQPATALLQAETIWQSIRSVLTTSGTAAADALFFSGPTRKAMGL
ncbi:SDR family NAD(P)-dependent oxidoreductase [Rhizobium sp. CFBP 8762]|uniref:SDR family NAD(P)-dependent oxidoreductase n=1 Tax=Rhizobium sp. CFBP 8762 TaxID=2775279 RepID=UPI001780FBE1|nr:SDR family NAD(P)-dependent oxidoreductase [Rhizobium sp. CFBP 8762]MBD8554769.1 SDR family NAD(P)-dependent oxidoreductase [Rhizobium sp. CFBP 8762]